MRGRPPKYDKDTFPDLAYKYCLLGATNAELARNFGVSVAAIELWLRNHEEFLGAVKAGREEADANVAKSLYHRALGYKTDDKHYPPDATAMIWWLKNRRPDLWREKQEQVISGPDGGPVQVSQIRLTGPDDNG